MATCKELLDKRSTLQTRLQHVHTEDDRQATLDQIADVQEQIDAMGCEKAPPPKPNPPSCGEFFAKREHLQTQLQHAHLEADRQTILDQIADVDAQIDALGCHEVAPPPQPPPPQLFPEMSYQFLTCLAQLEKELLPAAQSSSAAQSSLSDEITGALVQAAKKKAQKDYPEAVNNPVAMTDCVQQRERGGLWLAPTEKEDALKTHLSYIGDLFKPGDGTLYALQIAGFLLHHLAQIAWNKLEKLVVSPENFFNTPFFVGQFTSYQLSLVPPNQIVLQVTAHGHFLPGELVPGPELEEIDQSATFTFTLNVDRATGQLKSDMTPPDKRVPDIGQSIVSIFPTVILLSKKADQQQAYKLVFLYDDLRISEEEGIVVGSIQSVYNLQDPANFLQVRQPSVDFSDYSLIEFPKDEAKWRDPDRPNFIKLPFLITTIDMRYDEDVSPLQVQWNIEGDVSGKALSSGIKTDIIFGPIDEAFLRNGGMYTETIRVDATDNDGFLESKTKQLVIQYAPRQKPGSTEPDFVHFLDQ